MRLPPSCALACVVIVLATHVRAAPPPRFETGITLVTLSAFVTDRDGKPISGLTADDLEVFDDGKPTTIVQFQEVDALARLPAEDRGSWALQAASRRQFLFLFDLSFSHPAGIVRARKAALRLAEDGLAASDLAGVATFSIRRGLRMILGLTTDRRQLARAIETLGLLDTERAPDALALTYELGAGAESARDARKPGWEEHMAAQGALAERGDRTQYMHGVSEFLSGLEHVAQTLGALRGHKQVLLLSAGYDPAVVAGDHAGFAPGEMSDRVLDLGRVRQAFDDITRAFAAADAVVHAVDVSGLVPSGDVSEFSPGDNNEAFRNRRRRDGRESLHQIAHVTGGELVRDANELDRALREVIDRSRRYYVVAIEPVSRGEGKHHRLQVRVRTPGARVSHRRGYVEAPAARTADAATRRIQAAEAIAKGLSGGDLPVRALAVPYRDAEGHTSVPVAIEIDGESLLAGRSSGTLPLEIYGYAFDERESVVDTVFLTPTVDVAMLASRVRRSGLQVQTAFSVPAGRTDLRFLVHDVSTGRTGALRVEVTVPSFAPETLALSPPVVLADGDPLVVVVPSRSAALPEMPCRVEGQALVPQVRPRLANGRAASVCLLALTPTPFDARSSLEISAHLRDGTGARVPLGKPPAVANVVGERDGFRRFLLKLTPSGVRPGEYMLHIRLKDPLAADAIESVQPVRID